MADTHFGNSNCRSSIPLSIVWFIRIVFLLTRDALIVLSQIHQIATGSYNSLFPFLFLFTDI